LDWKVFLTTFCMIFLAELGDKTQLAAISMASETKLPLAVFLGSMAAFGVITLIGVLIGGTLTKFIPQIYIRTAAGFLFIIVGVLTLTGFLK
jgi:Ca2+/H+ antiporter, TMEM165/GDT1 family